MKYEKDAPIFDQLSSEQLNQLLKIFESEEFKLYREVMQESFERRSINLLARIRTSSLSEDKERYEIARMQGEINAIETLILKMGDVIDLHIKKAKEEAKKEKKK